MLEYIKICGLKNTEDINVCTENGANAIGFIYNVPNSPRNLDKDTLLNLLQFIPQNIKSVITFRASSASEVKQIMNEIHADLYQTHCSFNIRDLDTFFPQEKKKLIIALKVTPSSQEDVIKKINMSFDQFFAFLLDNSQGSGQQFDYDLFLNIRRMTFGTKLIIAGGINSENIASLIKNLQPYGIDASSSLESERGVKDPNKIKDFLRKIYKNTELNL